MMRWRPILPVAAAATAATSVAGAGAGASKHGISSATATATAAASCRLLFVRPPRVSSRHAFGTGPTRSLSDKKRRQGPESLDEDGAPAAAAADEPRPYFPPTLPTVERMLLLRAQARAGDDDAEEDQAPRTQTAGHEEAVVMAWLKELVIGLKLCPWAAPALNAGAIHIKIHPGGDDGLEALTQTVIEEAVTLAGMPEVGRNATVLIGVPHALGDFEAFLDYAAVVDDMIDELGLRGKVQLASFHPEYTFADSTPETEVEDYTNRSPFPLLHLLREVEVSRALAHYPGDPDAIWKRNKAVMREMGKQQLQALIDACKGSGGGSGAS